MAEFTLHVRRLFLAPVLCLMRRAIFSPSSSSSRVHFKHVETVPGDLVEHEASILIEAGRHPRG